MGWLAGWRGSWTLLIVCVVGCLEGFVAERLTWRLGEGHSLGGEDGGPRKGGAQAEGELRRSPRGWETLCTLGEHLWWGWCLTAVPLAWPCQLFSP